MKILAISAALFGVLFLAWLIWCIVIVWWNGLRHGHGIDSASANVGVGCILGMFIIPMCLFGALLSAVFPISLENANLVAALLSMFLEWRLILLHTRLTEKRREGLNAAQASD